MVVALEHTFKLFGFCIDGKAKVKLSLHLTKLSANKLSLVSHLSCFVSLPSEGLQSTPANYSKLYALSVCAISGC